MAQKVKVYSTPSCPWCKLAKELLKKHSIPFEDLDVGSNLVARREMIQKSGQMGVPVIEIDEEIIIGYDEPQLRKKLNLPA